MKTIDELQAEIAGLRAILQDKDKEIETLEKAKKEKSEQIAKLNKLNDWYMEQLKLKAKEKFGKSSEKLLMDNFLFLMSSMRLKHLESQFKVSHHRKVLCLSIKEEKLKKEASLMTFLLR